MISSASMFASLAPYIASALLLFLLLEQLSYLIKKRNLPGPLFVPPLIGNAVALVRDPTSFWYKQSSTAGNSPGLSANYLVGRFILYIRDTELSHQVFSNVRPDAFHLVGHPFGKKLFGDHNLIYMFGEDHKSVRRQLAPNFTPKALSTYTALQQLVILRHLRRWEESFSGGGTRPVVLRNLVRELNLETSQTVFVGPYLDKEARDRFRKDYNLFNLGSMALPVDLPGFAFGEARRAVTRLAETLAVCAGKSKARMAAGEEPTCLIDFWMPPLAQFFINIRKAHYSLTIRLRRIRLVVKTSTCYIISRRNGITSHMPPFLAVQERSKMIFFLTMRQRFTKENSLKSFFG